MLTVPVVSRATVTTLDVSVTSAFSGDGAAVANTDASVTVEVKNLNQAGDVYYRIGSGSWVNVLARQSTLLTLDLSAATLYLKRGQYSDTVAVRLTINGVPSGLYADATSLTEGAGASAFTALTDAPASYSGQGGKAVSVKSDASGLEFTAGGGDTPLVPVFADTFDGADGPLEGHTPNTSTGPYTGDLSSYGIVSLGLQPNSDTTPGDLTAPLGLGNISGRFKVTLNFGLSVEASTDADNLEFALVGSSNSHQFFLLQLWGDTATGLWSGGLYDGPHSTEIVPTALTSTHVIVLEAADGTTTFSLDDSVVGTIPTPEDIHLADLVQLNIGTNSTFIDSVLVLSTGGGVGAATFTDLTATGVIALPNLPVTDPAVAGQLWDDAGVLKISAGP